MILLYFYKMFKKQKSFLFTMSSHLVSIFKYLISDFHSF